MVLIIHCSPVLTKVELCRIMKNDVEITVRFMTQYMIYNLFEVVFSENENNYNNDRHTRKWKKHFL